MASLARAYWQALLSQGICVGLGMGCLLIPSVGTASTWFSRRRGLAVGVVTSGSAVGGIVLPIVTQQLLPRIGFGWTLRVLGFVSMTTLSLSVAVMRQRLPPRKRGEMFAFGALRELPFALYSAGMFVALLGFYVFLQFVQSVSTRTSCLSSSVFFADHLVLSGLKLPISQRACHQSTIYRSSMPLQFQEGHYHACSPIESVQ
jgi:MFS family permease